MADRIALFIVGPPAAGKTTAARAWLGPLDEAALVQSPKWTIAHGGRIVAAGHYTGATFDGADQVPYNGARAALEYWANNLRYQAEVTVFDGDRFSNASTVGFLAPYVDRIVVEYVDAPEDVLAARRAARGWAPSPAWLKGRATKARRFFERFG